MTGKEAKRLKVGDAVVWENDAADRGEVIEVGYCAVKIRWENGGAGVDGAGIGVLHVDDCENVSRAA